MPMTSHRWSRWGEAWDGDHLYPLWPGKCGAFGHAFDPCSAVLTWASHGGNENLHQFSILPIGILQPLLCDIAILPESASIIQFPLSWLCLCRFLLFCPNQVIMPKEEADVNELKITPITAGALWESSIEGQCLSSLVPLSVPATSPST